MEPSSSDLKYFIETVRAKSISAAAINLDISQPSLSLAIQRIERFLGEKILIRGRNGATATTAGCRLLANSKRLIDAWNDLRLQVHAAEKELRTQVVIGCHPEVAIDSLPLFLPKILETYPKLEISLVHGLSRIITEKVISGEVDIGIVVNPRQHPDLVIQKLSSDEVNFWVAPGNKQIQSPTSGRAVLFCDTELAQSQTLIKRAEKNIRFGRIIHTNDLEVVSNVVASGAGIGILPSEVALRNPINNLTVVRGVLGYIDYVALIKRFENKKNKSIEILSDLILEGHRQKYEKFN